MMLVGVILYSARKRVSWLGGAGGLGNWLQFHIFLCTLGPLLVLLHTTFRFGGIVSIAFWSMVLVVASGVFGRYVFARIPKASDSSRPCSRVRRSGPRRVLSTPCGWRFGGTSLLASTWAAAGAR